MRKAYGFIRALTLFFWGWYRGKEGRDTQPGGENHFYEGEIMYYLRDSVLSGLTWKTIGQRRPVFSRQGGGTNDDTFLVLGRKVTTPYSVTCLSRKILV